MYNSHLELANSKIVDGIKIKVLKQDESVILTELDLLKGTILPAHIHTCDHSAYLLKGKIRLISNGVASDFSQGDSWCIKSDICHATEALEDSIVLEIYSMETDEYKNLQFFAEPELQD